MKLVLTIQVSSISQVVWRVHSTIAGAVWTRRTKIWFSPSRTLQSGREDSRVWEKSGSVRYSLCCHTDNGILQEKRGQELAWKDKKGFTM